MATESVFFLLHMGSDLFTGQSDHVQRAVHEATNQSLRAILCGDNIIHPVVGGDILQYREEK